MNVNFLWNALQYPFMQQALIVAMIVSVTCALLSCFLVLKGWALMGDAISHAILPGVVIAAVLGIPLIIGAFVAGLACALATGWFERRSVLKSDTLLGIIFSGMFAAGIIMFQKINTDQHLTHILFGNLLGMKTGQRIQVFTICSVILLVLAFKWRDFMLFVFDTAQARLSGLPVSRLYTALLAMLALTAVGAIQAVGVILVVAMLIAPGISAQLVVSRFHHMLIVAALLSLVSTCTGVIVSFYTDASTGSCIVLLQAAGFFSMLILRCIMRHYKTQTPKA